ncbi:MAG: hypothetical protein U9M95_06030 [Candidatus Altiarchaeota archaeon]|nr:hypothetical protein [Candidatus Altiarchaeota archaeon]
MGSYNRDFEDSIISLFKRRPCNLEDISDALGLRVNEIADYPQELGKKNIDSVISEG